MSAHSALEATVEFKLFSLVTIDDEALKRKRTECMEYLSPWVLDYPWYNESFTLHVSTSSQMRKFLFGRTKIGESIEDEWFIVWLLFQLTKNDPSIIVQIRDEDGEFLLIEAAEELPKWLSPDNASNRTWIHNGQLCIIQKDAPGVLSIDEAFSIFSLIKNNADTSYYASAKIQAMIHRRISGYPERIQSVKHRTHVKLPYLAAAVLTLPGHASVLRAALNAWADHHNDMVAVRQWRRQLKENSTLFCRSTRNVKTLTKPLKPLRWSVLMCHNVDFVLRVCTLSRIQYAKLRSLPTPTGIQCPENMGCSSMERTAIELGLKLCAGLDLLLAQAQLDASNRFSPALLNYEDCIDTTALDNFLSRLTRVGYFRNELPGSRLYQQLTADAKEFFVANVAPNQSTESMDIQSPAVHLIRLLDDLERNPDLAPSLNEFRTEEQSLVPADDESWLFITPDELDAMLSASTGQMVTTVNDDCDDNKPATMAEVLDKLISSKSSFEGIELDANKIGSKRKCVGNHTESDDLTDDEDSCDEAKQDQLVSEDSEDGFNEPKAEDSNEPLGTGDSLNMYDMMRSLMSKIGDPFNLGTRETITNSSKNLKKSHEQTNSIGCQRTYCDTKGNELLSSDSSDDELLNLYAPNTDKHRDYGNHSLSSSELDSDELEPISNLTQNPSRTINNQSGKQTLCDVIPKTVHHPTKILTNYDDSSDDEEKPQISQLPWQFQSQTRKPINNKGLARPHHVDAMQSSSGTGSMSDYVAQMESELSGQPANVGRLEALIDSDALLRSAYSRNKRGLSDRKKPRRNPDRAQLAQAEEFDSEDSDDLEVEPQPSTSHNCIATPLSQMPDVSNHVMRNLCASVFPPGSEWQQPTGPATQLFAALGIPVNQLASAGRPGERNPHSAT